MSDDKLICAIGTIERNLGRIEGLAEGMETKYANILFSAVTRIDEALKVLTDGK